MKFNLENMVNISGGSDYSLKRKVFKGQGGMWCFLVSKRNNVHKWCFNDKQFAYVLAQKVKDGTF